MAAPSSTNFHVSFGSVSIEKLQKSQRALHALLIAK